MTTRSDKALALEALVDPGRLGAWLTEQGLGAGPVTDLRRLSGGSQNLLVRLSFDGQEYVLRRGPTLLRPGSNELISREAAVLTAIANSPVPHAALLARCDDEDVLGGARFYLTAFVDGFSPMLRTTGVEIDCEIAAHMVWETTDALAAIAAVDSSVPELDRLGRTGDFIARQVPRWLDELDRHRRLDGYPPDALGDLAPIAEWLVAREPGSAREGLVHGDYYVGNLLFSHARQDVVAVVDWELATIGDPLLDLGLLLATVGFSDKRSALLGHLARAEHLPSPVDVARRYGESTGHDLSDIGWFTVLACFKTAIIAEGTYARACAGIGSTVFGDVLHSISLDLLQRARRLVAVDGDIVAA